jgi:hypothetical protein
MGVLRHWRGAMAGSQWTGAPGFSQGCLHAFPLSGAWRKPYYAPLTLTEVADPCIGASDVLVPVKACGVCHSDLHLTDDLFNSFGLRQFPCAAWP